MKTTLEISDELFRQAKAHAALEGIRLRDLVERGLRLAMAEQSHDPSYRVDLPLIRTRAGSHPITSEQVQAAQAQMDEEEAEHNGGFMRR